jgi:hypothetical protein
MIYIGLSEALSCAHADPDGRFWTTNRYSVRFAVRRVLRVWLPRFLILRRRRRRRAISDQSPSNRGYRFGHPRRRALRGRPG